MPFDETLAFLRTHESLDDPDIELGFVPAPFVDGGYGTPTAHAMSLSTILLQPASRGSIVPRGPEAAHPPRIDPGYFTEPGVRSALRIFDAEGLATHAGDWLNSPTPNTTNTATKAFIRRNAGTPHATVVALAVRAADLIRAQHP